MTRRIPLAGRTFGRLTVLEDLPSKPGLRKCEVSARCECGREVVLAAAEIRSGNTRSCGCLREEMRGSHTRTHGQSKSSQTYSSWMDMRSRCNKPDNEAYPRYGGRGIRVCERWSAFENFRLDMGDRPAGKTLDRIDNDGNYEPDNCRWATPAEQARNRRSNILLTIDGETKCLLDWCNEKNVAYAAAAWWVRVRGLPPRDALIRVGAVL